MLRPVYHWLQRSVRRPGSREQFLEYWTLPNDGLNRPCDYTCEYMNGRSRLLVDLVTKYADRTASIYEIGGGVGRNLAFLHDAGFRNLDTIELSPQAIAAFHETYPAAARATTIRQGTIEEVIASIPTDHYDVVFTMTVLQHIHPRSRRVFEQIVRITKRVLITIENEQKLTWRHVPRDYRKIFEPLGLVPLEMIPCQDHGMSGENVARVFAKRGSGS